MLKSNPPTSIQPMKGSRTQRFQKYAFQECFYKKKTTTFLHCKCHKLLIFNATLEQVTQPLKTNHWCLGITAQMSIEWGRLSSPGKMGRLWQRISIQNSNSFVKKCCRVSAAPPDKPVCAHCCTWVEDLTRLIGIKCVYTQGWMIPTINSIQNLPTQSLWITWGSHWAAPPGSACLASFLEFTGNQKPALFPTI